MPDTPETSRRSRVESLAYRDGGCFHANRPGRSLAWSVFRIPLSETYGWTITEVALALAFEIAIFVSGFASFVGGLWLWRSGPRPVALTATVCYGLGVILAGTAHTLPSLYLTYGLLGGAGLGLGYHRDRSQP